MQKPDLKRGTRVSLKVPTNVFEGIDPDPLPVGSRGVVHTILDNYYVVQWDNAYTLTHEYDELTPLKKGD